MAQVVLVRFVGAPAEPAVPHVLDIGRELKRGIPFIRIAGSGADEDRRVRLAQSKSMFTIASLVSTKGWSYPTQP